VDGVSDDDLLDLTAYVIPEGDAHPGILFQELIELDEHAHFKEHEIPVEFLLRVGPKVKAGRRVLGQCALPVVQGEFRDLFQQLLAQWFGRLPMFLIILDQEFWTEASPREREALLFHELSHVKQSLDKNGDPAFDKDGNPKFGLVEHDITAFNAEVARYGAWHSGIADFLAAASAAE
jgi:hypothetical protein